MELADRADTVTPEQRSKIMSRIPQRDTAPEMKICRLLHASGYRYRLHRSGLESQPSIEHAVEAEFLRPVLLGESILPYRLFRAFEGVVPVQGSTVLDSEMAANPERGFDKLAGWLRQAEVLWDHNKVNGSKLSWAEQQNYNGKLAAQFPIAALRIVYSKSGTLPAACLIRDKRAVIDHMLYWTQPASEDEAHYLTAILNSETARGRAEQFQARGQFGARHFDKVMFNLPIPLFKGTEALHRELAEAGAQAETVAANVELKEGEKFQRARKRVRDALAEDGIGGDIEKLVEKLLGPV